MKRHGKAVLQNYIGAEPASSCPEFGDYPAMIGAPLRDLEGPLMSQTQYEGLQAMFAGLDSKVEGMAHRLGAVERGMEIERKALGDHLQRIHDKLDAVSGDGVAMEAIRQHEERGRIETARLERRIDANATWIRGIAAAVVVAVLAGAAKLFF